LKFLKNKIILRLRKAAKIVTIVFASLIALYVVAWIGVSWYINAHKTELLQKISAQVSDKVNGNFHIEDIQPALLKGFPSIAVELKGISLSDSLYSLHHQNLIEIQSVYIKANIFSLLTGHPKAAKLTLENGRFYLFTDSSGYSNDYLLKLKNKNNHSKNADLNFDNFAIENFTIDIEHPGKQLLFLIKNMKGYIHSNVDGMDILADSKLHVKQLAFNLAKGGYLTNKDVEAKFHLTYNGNKKLLQMLPQKVKINKTNLLIGADFDFAKNPSTYALNISVESINFREAASIVPRNVSEKLQRFDFKKNIPIKVTVTNGHLTGADDPIVYAYLTSKDNDFITPVGEFQHANFNASFDNNIVANRPHGDDNSQIILNSFAASVNGIPVTIPNLHVSNLINPVMDFHFISAFSVERLNTIFGNTFSFKKGQVNINLTYHGGIDAKDSLPHNLTGIIRLQNGAFSYVPRTLEFKNGNANLLFKNNDLILQNATLSTNRSDITLSGYSPNFMSLYFKNEPQKIVFNWNLKSQKLVFDEFANLFNSTATTAAQNSNNNFFNNIDTNLSNIMRQSNINLHVQVDTVFFRTFSAQNLSADANFSNSELTLNNAGARFSGGNISADVFVRHNEKALPFGIKANVNSVEIDKLFKSFDNFQQTFITDKNLRGSVFANVNISGWMTPQANLVPNSISGKASFRLEDGQLLNFEPLMSIQKFIFKKRNLADVSFKNIQNTFSFSNGKVTVPPMYIASNVIELSLQGVYGFEKGTNIALAIPLRNPEKAEEEKTTRRKLLGNGIVVYLRARDNNDGDIRLYWDPLHAAPLKKNINDSD